MGGKVENHVVSPRITQNASNLPAKLSAVFKPFFEKHSDTSGFLKNIPICRGAPEINVVSALLNSKENICWYHQWPTPSRGLRAKHVGDNYGIDIGKCISPWEGNIHSQPINVHFQTLGACCATVLPLDSEMPVCCLIGNRIDYMYATVYASKKHKSPFGSSGQYDLLIDYPNRKTQNSSLYKSNDDQPFRESGELPFYLDILLGLGIGGLIGGGALLFDDHRYIGACMFCAGAIGFLCLSTAVLFCDALFWRALAADNPDRCDCKDEKHIQGDTHNGTSVLQKYLDKLYSCSTVIDMANVLSKDKQIAVVSALAEGSSIRSIERMTGINRNTIMNLGVRVGKGCTSLLDAKMRDLPCRYLQFDEVWGFIGKKERHCSVDDNPEYGDVWTFCAIDAETKLVPSFKCGKRNLATAKVFVEDVASRMRTRVHPLR